MPSRKPSTTDTGRSSDNQSQKQKTGADFDQTVRQAESEKKTKQPGQKSGNNSKQHNNGRGGGK